jgi:predicted DNA-binding transcriptional regulator AlpA
MTERAINQFMRRQAVAFELGISRHTIARMLKADASFPRFFEITPGISVIARADFDGWLRNKRLTAFTKPK